MTIFTLHTCLFTVFPQVLSQPFQGEPLQWIAKASKRIPLTFTVFYMSSQVRNCVALDSAIFATFMADLNLPNNRFKNIWLDVTESVLVVRLTMWTHRHCAISCSSISGEAGITHHFRAIGAFFWVNRDSKTY